MWLFVKEDDKEGQHAEACDEEKHIHKRPIRRLLDQRVVEQPAGVVEGIAGIKALLKNFLRRGSRLSV